MSVAIQYHKNGTMSLRYEQWTNMVKKCENTL